MSDRRTDNDLETRLQRTFRAGELPAAPGRLLDALERVPDAPVVRRGAKDASRRGGRTTGFGLLGLAAVLVVGGALALSGGSRQQDRSPSPTGPLSGVPSGDASVTPGAQLTYQVGWTAAVPYSPAVLDEELRIVQGRIDATGVVGVAPARAEGASRLVVDLPEGMDPNLLRPLIAQTGRTAFVPLGEAQANKGDQIDPARFPELFGNEGIAGAVVAADQTGGRVIQITLTPAAAELFRQYTASHIGNDFAITLDGIVVSAPVINSEIPGGNVEISQGGTIGGWDAADANRLTTIVRLGPLPAPLTEISAEPGPSSSPSTSAQPGPSSSPVASAPTFKLERSPADLGCDAMPAPYRFFTINIDPMASEQPVWGITDTGLRIRVFWGAHDRGLVGPPPVIVDGDGVVIARDDTRIDIPDSAWPSLAGRFVCPGPDAVYITDQPAAQP